MTSLRSHLSTLFTGQQHSRAQTLIHTAKKVQSEGLSAPALDQLNDIAKTEDEIGEMAAIFREMALVVDAGEKNLSEQITALQTQANVGTGSIDTQQARGFELAYYEALRKKSAWLRRQHSEDASYSSV